MRRSPWHPLRPGWVDLLAGIEPGTVLVLGGPRTGKSALTGFLTGQLSRGRRRVALVDADPAQSEVGPAGCLGLALTSPWQAPAALWFAGTETAERSAHATVLGAGRLAARARGEGAELVVIDPPALVAGGEREAILRRLAQAARVDQVVALDGAGDGGLAEALAAGGTVHRSVSSPLGVLPRRAGRQEGRLRAHLASARLHRFPHHALAADPAGPGAGEPEPSLGAIVGLVDPDGFCLALGVIDELGEDAVGVFTAWDETETVSRLELGEMRCERVSRPAEDAPGVAWRMLRAG